MDKIINIVVFGLMIQHGYSRSMPEDSVVSDYTKEGSGPGLDVYQQIANNIAERITSPIYRFLGYNNTEKTEVTTKKPWEKVEILETPSAKSLAPVSNDISKDKDVEELSDEAIKRIDKKPEKITLFSNYLPLDKLELNDTQSDDDDFDSFGFDDVESDADLKPREQGPFVFILELIGSFIQLVYGAVVSFFQRSPAQSS
ncbi:uncharacterized protein LOC119834175 [Zerene cesonia]|uniref:uncharacterized protein LOC119834175 n=1 Tax=Zerene cesonia TaxID=33412 RepID=UPI0018E53C39|nr:uncharacterized protein LOC119834175 [Zerene cesonia]